MSAGYDAGVEHRSGPGLLIRAIWWFFIGWWASGIWMAIAWFVQLTIIGIPIALMIFNRTPFVASLYRY